MIPVFPCSSAGKESTCNEGDLCWIPGLGRSPGEGKGYPLQYSGLENSMDCLEHGVAKSDTPEHTHLLLQSDPNQFLSWASLVAQTVKTACNSGCLGSIPESGRSPGKENGYPLQFSYLRNSMDRRA